MNKIKLKNCLNEFIKSDCQDYDTFFKTLSLEKINSKEAMVDLFEVTIEFKEYFSKIDFLMKFFTDFEIKKLNLEDSVFLRNWLFQNRLKIEFIADLVYFMGILEKKLKVLNNAINCFEKVLTIKQNHMESLRQLSFIMLETSRLDDAMNILQMMLKIDPSDWKSWNDGGCTLREKGLKEEALIWMREAIQRNKTNSSLLANTALLEFELHNYKEAQFYLDKCFKINKNEANALHTQAMLYEGLGNHKKSYEFDLKALKVKPNYTQARFGLALSALTMGNFEEGFSGYELRWTGSDKVSSNEYPSILKPTWLGQKVYSSSSIVVFSEQGYGDIIQFTRFIPELLKYFREINFVVPTLMYRLIKQTLFHNNINIYTNVSELNKNAIEYEIPLMSLPLALNVTLDNLIAPKKYILVDKVLENKWKNRFKKDTNLKIGIAWTGKETLSKQELRSINPELFSTFNDIPNITFVNLQKQYTNKELNPLKNFVNYINECEDFMDTAALISSLDLVISVDTVIVHLSAALGKPTYLLNRLGSEWRWLDAKKDSPWYPTMKIFNQKELAKWDDVIEEIKKLLKP